ncbi:MAG: DUF3445 domain-containing protein [Verrucomicrobiales bacterium]|nr:DUF3445 domain-containing protein [Verrucomicrobiales bacterium]
MKGLFPPSDFSWSMRMRRESAEQFFAPQDRSGKLLAQKRHWLETRPELCLAATGSADRLTEQCRELALNWGHIPADLAPGLASLSSQWEADLIFMDGETTHLSGGCVCFPSSWSLQESVGVSLFDVHNRVPGLNAAIGDKIRTFLANLSPGKAFFRENWGITRTSELNYHPELKRKPLDHTINAESAFLRIEHQCFVKLQGGILLAVRIEPVGFPELVKNAPETATQLLRQLRTMPPEVAEYKSLTQGLDRAVQILDQLLAH